MAVPPLAWGRRRGVRNKGLKYGSRADKVRKGELDFNLRKSLNDEMNGAPKSF